MPSYSPSYSHQMIPFSVCRNFRVLSFVKRMRIESDETYLELFGREDSDEELYIDDDEVEGFAEIDEDGGINGCNRDPNLFTLKKVCLVYERIIYRPIRRILIYTSYFYRMKSFRQYQQRQINNL